MKVLFLDIDGVVNCESTKQRHMGYIGIDPKKAQIIKDIINQTKCVVVLSSTWRLDEESQKEVRKKVCDFIDTTPSLKSGHRGDEITEWLRKEDITVEKYAILDDESDFYEWQPLVRTSWQTGITQEHANKVMELLK